MTYRNDWKKLLIVEIKRGKQLQAATWTHAAPVYSTPFTYGEVVSLKLNSTFFTREGSVAACIAADNSYYHDFFAGILYVHIVGGLNPGAYVSPNYTYSIIAYTWKCISNRQDVGVAAVVFVPTDCVYPVLYDPTLCADSLSELTATVADHFESAMETSAGSISITNAGGEWYAAIDDFYWNNGDIRAKIGEIGDTYAALETIFLGKVRTPDVGDDIVTFELVDAREGQLKSIPSVHYETTTYPNLNVDAIGLPIPVLFGEKTNITPVCIDTAAYTYKISQTHFGTAVFEMSSIDAVYFKGMTLSLATHYTVDLHNGEFTLTFAPGDGLVTCNAKGIKDAFDMTTGLATGLYSENVADHWFFVLNVLNEIPIVNLKLTDFADLRAARTQAVAWLLDTDTPTIDFNRLLQQTSLYHFLPLNDGTFTAKYYRKTVPAGTLELRNYDHAGFRKKKQSDGVFYNIILKYAKDPTTGLWKTVQASTLSVFRQHNTKETYTVETALRDTTEANTVLAFYVALLKDPATKIDTSISLIGSGVLPTDKLYNNRDIIADGKAVTIDTNQVYDILQTRKNFSDGRVGITAQLATQLEIYTTHADIAHQDVAHADHSDVIHTDAAHGNSYTDHDDNISHSDTAPHADHSDTTHNDYDIPPHGYSDHTNTAHDDFDHIDIPAYTDHDDIVHVDSGHVDHSDTIHTDAHTDVSHIDSEV